jgi:type VI secretion system protein
MRARLLLPVVALLALCGCQTLSKLIPGHVKTTDLSTLRVAAQPGANLNSATALDVVFVYDATAVALLPQTGPDWFEKKAALQSGLGLSIDVVPLQIPPAMLIDTVKLPKRAGKALAVYGFANYLSKDGQGRLDMTRYRRPVIWLAPAQITVTEP